jgi:hypothetical protein
MVRVQPGATKVAKMGLALFSHVSKESQIGVM